MELTSRAGATSYGHEEFSQHRENPRKKMKERRVSLCVLNQPMHGGDSSTCLSRYLIKSGSIPIVNPALSFEKLIIANHIYHATNDNVLF